MKPLNVRHANNSLKRNEQTRGVRWSAQQQQDLSLLKLDRIHSINKRAINKYKLIAMLSIALIALQGTNTAYAASYSVDHLKLYAHSRILNYKEFQCFNHILHLESRWNYKSKNGSHFGLGQMRSTYYRDLDPYRMIDASLRYITKRYQSSCKALEFHKAKGYY